MVASHEEHPLLSLHHPSDSMSAVPIRTTRALEDEEQGKTTAFSEKVDDPLTSRPSRSRSVRSARSETQVSGSSTSGEAEGDQRGQPSRSTTLETVRRNPSPGKRWWARVRGKDRKKIGWKASLKAIVLSSCTSIHSSLAAFNPLCRLERNTKAYFGGRNVSFSNLKTGFRSDLLNEKRVRR